MKPQKFIHLTAHVRPGIPSLCQYACAQWLWQYLRRAFPDALGCTLMPDHLHVLTPAEDAHSARTSLTAILGHYTRNFGNGELGWKPIPDSTPVRGTKILRRSLRYLALNPCRENLAPDPLAWIWSTHRDVMGAVCNPWVPAARLASALGQSPTGFRRRYHTYISSDQSVNSNGTPPPRSAAECKIPQYTPADLARAVQSATRKPPGALQQRGLPRSLFIHLALNQGWRDRQVLARITEASPRTIKRIITRPPDPHALKASLLCLGDPRLRRSF